MSRLKTVRNGVERSNVATRFKPGNQAAVGRSGGTAAMIAKLKATALDEFDPDDWHLILQAMIEKAMKGDVAAAVFVRDTIGLKPKDEVEARVQSTILDMQLQAALIEVQVNA